MLCSRSKDTRRLQTCMINLLHKSNALMKTFLGLQDSPVRKMKRTGSSTDIMGLTLAQDARTLGSAMGSSSSRQEPMVHVPAANTVQVSSRSLCLLSSVEMMVTLTAHIEMLQQAQGHTILLRILLLLPLHHTCLTKSFLAGRSTPPRIDYVALCRQHPHPLARSR